MLYYVLIFTLGTIVGSFLNVVIYRLNTGERIINSRSHCTKCGHVLSWRELIPVFSFLAQKGKCKKCDSKISWQYPFVEIGTGLVFLAILSFNFQFSIFNEFSNFTIFKIAYLFTISSLLIVLFVYDLKHYILPDKILYPAICIVIAYRLIEFGKLNHWNLSENWKLKVENLGALETYFYSAFGAFVFFLIIYVLSRGRGLGFGDVKFAFFMGLFLGWPNILVGLFLSWILGGIIGIGLLVLGKKGLKSQIPFGPFLVTGTFVAMLWGEELIGWYLDFLGIT